MLYFAVYARKETFWTSEGGKLVFAKSVVESVPLLFTRVKTKITDNQKFGLSII